MDNELLCPSCGFSNNEESRFCRGCGFQIDPSANEADQILVFDYSQAPQSGKRFSIIEFFIVIGIVLILAAIALPGASIRGSRPMAREKACYANMRVLLGATEMYNMDHTETQSTLDEDFISVLIEGKYLRSKPECPEKGKYGTIGDLNGDGVISCSVHGTVESDR